VSGRLQVRISGCFLDAYLFFPCLSVYHVSLVVLAGLSATDEAKTSLPTILEGVCSAEDKSYKEKLIEANTTSY
jgi:hypothetical protein